MLRTLTILAVLGASAGAQKPSFVQVRQRIETERGAPAAERLAAIGLLQRFDTGPALGYALRLFRAEKDVAVRTQLVHVLARHKHKAVVSALAADLGDQWSYNHQWYVAHALARQGHAGVAALLKSLREDKGESTRRSVLWALGGVDSKSARDALMRAFESEPPPLRRDALGALEHQKTTPKLTRLRQGALQSEDAWIRTVALYQLSLDGVPGVAEAAVAAAARLDEVRKAGVVDKLFYALGTVLGPDTIGALLRVGAQPTKVRAPLQKLGDGKGQRAERFVAGLARLGAAREDAAERAVAVELLGLCKRPEVTQLLLPFLHDSSHQVATAALRQLSGRGGECRAELEGCLGSDDPDQVDEALRALQLLRKDDPQWPNVLMGYLDSDQRRLRLAAMDLLAELDYRPALPAVLDKLASPEWPERAAAYAFCKRVRDARSVPALIARVGREEGRLRGDLDDVLQSLSGKRYGAKVYWLRWWAAQGEGFEVPPPSPEPEPRPAGKGVLTYHGIAVESHRVCFVVDISGSMQEKAGTGVPRLAAAVEALDHVIDGSVEETWFNIVAFSGDAKPWKSFMKPATAANKKKARGFVDHLRAGGGTNFYAALEVAFADPDVDTIYLLSDGVPSDGEITDADALAAELARWNRDRRIVIHTIAIGADSALMKRLAEQSGGTYVRRL